MIHQAAQGAMDLKASPGDCRRAQEPRRQEADGPKSQRSLLSEPFLFS